MSWWFQSNKEETQQLLDLCDGGFREGFEAEVVRITEPLNVDSVKLAKLLWSLVEVDNIDRARKVVRASIPAERLASGPRQLGFVFLPIRVLFYVVRGVWRWWRRFLDAVAPS